MNKVCKNPILFRGEWMSAYGISKLTGISHTTIMKRARLGQPIEQRAPRPARAQKKYLFRGEMRTVAEVAAMTGRDKANVYRCIEGDSIREAKPYVAARYLTHDGKTLRLAEWSRLTGISHGAIIYRLSQGWTVEKALTKVPRHDVNPKITFMGITDSLSGWARRTGIPRQTLNERLSRGWSVKRALTEPVMKPEQRVIYQRNRRAMRRIAQGFKVSLPAREMHGC